MLRPLLLSLAWATAHCSLQPAGVISLQDGPASSTGTATGTGATTPAASNADAAADAAGWVAAPLAPAAGTAAPESPNVTSAASPNVADANSVSSASPGSLPAEWESIRYAFYDRARSAVGSASGYSLELYLSANPNFCTENANGTLVGGVLDEGENIYLVHIPAAVRGGEAGDYVGPSDYGTKAISMGTEARTTSSFALSPNVCQVKKTDAAYQGRVRVLTDLADTVSFTVAGTLASPSNGRGAAASVRAQSTRTFVAKYCEVCSATYEYDANGPVAPYSVNNTNILSIGPCQYQ